MSFHLANVQAPTNFLKETHGEIGKYAKNIKGFINCAFNIKRIMIQNVCWDTIKTHTILLVHIMKVLV